VKRNTERAFKDKNVANIFAAYPDDVRAKLKALREIIFDTAETIDGVGVLDETLKWGQPSYLTTETGSGSTIRIDRVKSDNNRIAIYFHCQTDLVAMCRELYPTQMEYGGNRSILFDAAGKIPEKALRHCIGLALTYHARKAAGKKKKSESPEKPALRTRRAQPS
jgi:hypothetical protein